MVKQLKGKCATKQCRDREQGFTFLELLLVLCVVSILTALIIPIGNKWAQAATQKEALQLLTSTVHSMQSYAMAHRVETKIEFVKIGDTTRYDAMISSGKVILSETYLPKGMRISPTSPLDIVSFDQYGDIINFGTMTLIISSGTIEIKFQFQRGRMIIGESEGFFMAGDNANSCCTRRHFWHSAPAGNQNNFSTL